MRPRRKSPILLTDLLTSAPDHSRLFSYFFLFVYVPRQTATTFISKFTFLDRVQTQFDTKENSRDYSLKKRFWVVRCSANDRAPMTNFYRNEFLKVKLSSAESTNHRNFLLCLKCLTRKMWLFVLTTRKSLREPWTPFAVVCICGAIEKFHLHFINIDIYKSRGLFPGLSLESTSSHPAILVQY